MDACTNPDVLRVILFIKTLINIVRFVIPIGLILFLAFDFFKNVIANKDEDMKKNVMLAIKRLLYAVIIFLIPAIVNFIMIVLGDLGVPYADCIANADINYITKEIDTLAAESLKKAKDRPTVANIIEAENYISKITDDNKRNSMQQEIEKIRETLTDEVRKQLEKEERDKLKIPTISTGDTSGTSTSTDILTTGTQGDYFAPLQDKSTYSVSGYSIGYTPGCANNVYHDASVSEGTPIYAGLTGEAKFRQTSSTKVVSGKTVLTSYGNQVVITGADGTYIIYAHLQKFANGINTPVTETCPKKGSAAPCSATVYSSSTATVDTKQVKKGELIGYTGNTGNSTGPHLHVEIHEKGSSYCRSDPWKAFGMR